MYQVNNIDDVLAYHTDFLNVCLSDCMLTNPELLKTVHKLMMVCVTFSNFMQVGGATESVPFRSMTGFTKHRYLHSYFAFFKGNTVLYSF